MRILNFKTTWSDFHHLPRVGPKQLCALAHLGCTCEAATKSVTPYMLAQSHISMTKSGSILLFHIENLKYTLVLLFRKSFWLYEIPIKSDELSPIDGAAVVEM